MKPKYNPIAFDAWHREKVRIETNRFSDDPVAFDVEDNCGRVQLWMMPDQARELAAKLIEAADAVDVAGLVS